MVAGGMESMSNVPMFESRSSPIYGNRTVKVPIRVQFFVFSFYIHSQCMHSLKIFCKTVNSRMIFALLSS